MAGMRRASSGGTSRLNSDSRDHTGIPRNDSGGDTTVVPSTPSIMTPKTPTPTATALPVFLGSPDMSLPVPVQSAMSTSSRRKTKKSARIDQGGGGPGPALRVHWARFKKRIGTGTAPSSSSEVGDSAYTGGSSVIGGRGGMQGEDGGGEDDSKRGPVDEVVVDRSWFDEIKSSVVSQSEQDPTKETGTGGGGGGASAPNGGTNTTDHDSMPPHPEGFWAWNMCTVMIRYRLWPSVMDFFSLRFIDEQSENHYRKETWFMQKVRHCFALT
jgi:osomolarity two-component system, sensor histidine kinase SLN1